MSTGRLVLKDLQEFTFSKNIGLHRLAVVNGHGNNTQIIENFLKIRLTAMKSSKSWILDLVFSMI